MTDTLTPGQGLFVCLWCFAVSHDPADYRYPLDALGGYDADTGLPLCAGGVEAAKEDDDV